MTGGQDQTAAGDDQIALLHELTTLGELRALSDPLRVSLFRLLREKERTVKELCDLLGESSTRLYYHVGELERVGLVRLVRTEARSGIVQKYYRSIARYVAVPLALLHDEDRSLEARAAVDWHAALIEHAATDVRVLFSERIEDADPETLFLTRNFVRISPERAREFVKRLEEFRYDLLAADEETGETSFAFTAVFTPDVRSTPAPRPQHQHPPAPRRARHGRTG